LAGKARATASRLARAARCLSSSLMRAEIGGKGLGSPDRHSTSRASDKPALSRRNIPIFVRMIAEVGLGARADEEPDRLPCIR
jgi:hypothetical protein